MLHLAVESAFEDLLAKWRAHESRQRRTDLSVIDLAASRYELDQARTRMHKLRTTLYPEADEVEAIAESVWCETLDAIVHLRWIDRDLIRPFNFRCTCGDLVLVSPHNP